MNKIISSLLLCNMAVYGQSEVLSHKMIDKNLIDLKNFVESFKPTHYVNGDTLTIAQIPTPPDSINKFLYYCIKNELHLADKYAFLAVMKLSKEFGRYDYDFCYYNNNGIVDLALDRVGFIYDEIGCSFFKTYDVYLWIKKNKKQFLDYPPLMKELSSIDKLLKNRK